MPQFWSQNWLNNSDIWQTEIAQHLIAGMYTIPDNVNNVAALILEEIGKTGIKLCNGEVEIEITPEEFQYF